MNDDENDGVGLAIAALVLFVLLACSACSKPSADPGAELRKKFRGML
jgi:hypothetical protein